MKKIILTLLPILFSLFLFIFSMNFLNKPIDKDINATVKTPIPTIIIDPGHGGFDGGASSKDGYLEKDANLQISLYLKEYLNFLGYKTVMTRENDSSTESEGLNTVRQRKVSDIHNRMKVMKETDNAIFISVHQNFYTEEKYNGMQVFYSKNFRTDSLKLADSIQKNGKYFLNNKNNRMIKECGSSVYLIFNAAKPAVLVECGFLSNKAEANKLKTDSYQKKVAYSIAMGIVDYYKS